MNNEYFYEIGEKVVSLEQNITGDGRVYPKGALFTITDTPESNEFNCYWLKADIPVNGKHYIGVSSLDFEERFELNTVRLKRSLRATHKRLIGDN